eukprot:2138306-Pleurochrysis_carterae.AAC.1
MRARVTESGYGLVASRIQISSGAPVSSSSASPRGLHLATRRRWARRAPALAIAAASSSPCPAQAGRSLARKARGRKTRGKKGRRMICS